MTVAVTGASGVVGRAVLRHLAASGRPVRALVRSPQAAAVVAELGATPVEGDLADYPSLVDGFRGAEVVYHVAGLNQNCPRRPDELMRVNVDGSRAVVRAARAVGVRRLVYTSSAATIGEAHGVVATEDTPHRGHYLSHYERSKHVAEQVVMAEAGPLELVVVNPSSVQGPGRATGTGKLIIDLLNGKLPALVETTLSVVDIDDCARGHLAAEERGVPGRRYLLNSFRMPLREAVELLEKVTGRQLRVRWVPVWAAMAAATAVEGVARVSGRTPPVCREMVRVLAHGHRYDGGRAAAELGITYTEPEVTLRRLVEWLRDRGLVP